MSVIFNADNGLASGSSGLKYQADSSGVLEFQSSGTTTLKLESNSQVTLAGSLVLTNSLVSTGSSSFSGPVTFQETLDVINTLTVSATTDYNTSTGSVFYHSTVAAAANWTANFTNLSTTNGRTFVGTILVTQGATAYVPSAVQIGGASQTINWVNGAMPGGNINKKDIFAFSLIRIGDAWIVLGQYATYG